MNNVSVVIDEMRDEIVSFLQGMVRIPSENPPGNYEAICDYLANQFSSYGFSVEVVDAPEDLVEQAGLLHPRRNVIGRLKGKGGGPTLILNAHVDTVPVGDDDRWTDSPFAGKIKDGRVYGRGATDSKGRIAAYVMAAVAIRRAGYELDGDIVIAATCDEETGGLFGAGYVLGDGHVHGDMAIVEGYSDQIIRAMAGILPLRIVTKGISAHAGWKWKGNNAIEQMAKVITSLAELQTQLEAELSQVHGMRYTAINIGTIRGGTKTNVVPDGCEIDVECRVIPEHTLDDLFARIETVIAKLMEENPELDVQVIRFPDREVQPTITSENSPLIRELQKSFALHRTEAVPVVGVLGQSDARWFIQNGIPAINFGPGTPNNFVHHPDEFMEIEDLIETTRIIATFALNAMKERGSMGES